jgi:tetratricopeptide (TPR) repeat protein
LLKKGHKLKKKEHFEAAIAMFTKVIEIDSNNHDAYYERSRAYIKSKQYDLALADLDTILSWSGFALFSLNERANLHLELGNYRKAHYDFTKVIQMNPNFLRAYLGRAKARMGINDFHGASRDCCLAINLNRNYAPSYLLWGQVNAALGIKGMAYENYSKVIELDKKCAEAYYQRGLLFIDWGKYQKALIDLEKAQKHKHPLAEQAIVENRLVYKIEHFVNPF